MNALYESPEEGNLNKELSHANQLFIYNLLMNLELSLRKYIGVSVGMVSLIAENLLSHPFLVLRRQCQVHHSATK